MDNSLPIKHVFMLKFRLFLIAETARICKFACKFQQENTLAPTMSEFL